MTRGRPFEPGNKSGPGRPKGRPNKKTREAQELFENHSPAIMALAISKCREDPQMLRMLASHIIPRQKVLPIKIGRLPMNTLEDLNRASEVVLNKAASGKISVAEALDLTAMIESRRRVFESQDLERRLSAWKTPAGSRTNTRNRRRFLGRSSPLSPWRAQLALRWPSLEHLRTNEGQPPGPVETVRSTKGGQ